MQGNALMGQTLAGKALAWQMQKAKYEQQLKIETPWNEEGPSQAQKRNNQMQKGGRDETKEKREITAIRYFSHLKKRTKR